MDHNPPAGNHCFNELLSNIDTLEKMEGFKASWTMTWNMIHSTINADLETEWHSFSHNHVFN